MLDIDYSRFKLYTRVWGVVFLIIGVVEFVLFLIGSISTEQPIPAPLTIPYVAAGIFAWYFPRSAAFVYYAVISAMGGIYGALISQRLNIFTVFYVLLAFFLVFLYTQMAAMETEEGIDPDPLMVDLFPKIAAGAGGLALLLSPLAALADSIPALGTPGVQIGVFALGIGAASFLEVTEQKGLSTIGTALGLVAIVIWMILTVL